MTQPSPARRPTDLERTFAKAERILRDELRSGGADRLVRGGLEAFLRYWRAEVRGQRPPDDWLQRCERVLAALDGYRERSPDARRAMLAEALRALQSERSAATTRPAEVGRPPSVGNAARPEAANARPPRLTPPAERYPLDAPLAEVKGVGPSRARALARLGLTHYGDLLRHYPNRYEHYPPPRPADHLLLMPLASFEGVVRDVQVSPINARVKKIAARLADASGYVTASWLRAGAYAMNLRPGQRIAVSGKVQAFGRQIVFDNPEWEPAEVEPLHTRRIVPIYPLTSGIYHNWLRMLIRNAVATHADALPDFLPASLREAAGLPSLGWATAQMHFPDDAAALERARRRLAFDELFMIQLVVLQRRLRWQANAGQALPRPERGLEILLGAQPFRLTGAQARVLAEITADLALAIPMSRLLQGEVGSGKTAVAAAALYVAVANGAQGVLMAPTEILAEQHFRTLADFYGRAAEALAAAGLPVPRVALLTGSMTRREKERIYLALQEGEVDALVGTQAIIQEGVEPKNLALAIVDEQHRFGVRQRVVLRAKGNNPHLLVMTATPIPRTLALTMHGDLDLSTIDELPPGRQPIRTVLLRPSERPLAYEHIRREVVKGRQAFLICPLVEDSPNLEARAATEEYDRLRQGELAGVRLALLHGRMRPAEKDAVMRRFRDGEFDVLVSTAVVEVGVDVPNATVMLIEGAERFGLAQLHQFRGRVGRGRHPATCVLLTDLEGGDGIERLNMMVRSNNGLELADFDLRQRGEGDFFGVRQSGLPTLQVARLDDVGLVDEARRAAARVLEADPELAAPEHALLAERLAEFCQRAGEPN